ncbi:hypothetical protein [Viridibacillus arvi]|uniref:hypothetical protein n=1 Tax=Viridibacillus arvi TaxID=263475 RepID=UPI0034CF3F86
MEELLRAYQEREIQKLRLELELRRKSRLYEIQYELPPLPELRTFRIFADSKDQAIMHVLIENPNRIIKKVVAHNEY